MNGWDLTDDEVLLALLRDTIEQIDPVPPAATAAALRAFDMFRVDDELATLVADSLDDDAVLVRHDAALERLLTFTAPALSVEVQLPARGNTIFGAIVPPAAAAVVEIESPTAVTTTTSDQLGRFHGDVAPGCCRLRVRVGDSVVVTPWIVR